MCFILIGFLLLHSALPLSSAAVSLCQALFAERASISRWGRVEVSYSSSRGKRGKIHFEAIKVMTNVSRCLPLDFRLARI